MIKQKIERRLCEIHGVEQRIIEEGKTPKESPVSSTTFTSQEYRILMKMK